MPEQTFLDISLKFLNAGLDSLEDKRCRLKNKNLDLKPLRPCNSERLKKLKSSSLEMLWKIGSIKIFAIFTGKH